MKDWDGKCLKMAKREVAIGHGNLKAITGKSKHLSGNKGSGANAATAAKHRIKSEIERYSFHNWHAVTTFLYIDFSIRPVILIMCSFQLRNKLIFFCLLQGEDAALQEE